jgi:cell division protein FtsI (penicillin-binding protein 3)
MSYGYEVKVTPLQILTFFNAIANDGKMVKPQFASEIRNHGKVERTFVTEVINPSVCSRATLRKAKKILEGVIEDGTATNLKSENIKLAGKTGTTLIYNQKTGYKEKSYQASFAGYFPADQPKYSCIVVIYSPQNYVYHGAYVAGPVFKEIANKVYATNLEIQSPLNAEEPNTIEIPYSKNGYLSETHVALQGLNIKSLCEDSNTDWIVTEKHDEHIALKPKRIIDNLVPNVVSMGLKDAVFLLENMGLKVDVVGRGSVKSQSITPGTRIRKGDRIKLELSFTEG